MRVIQIETHQSVLPIWNSMEAINTDADKKKKTRVGHVVKKNMRLRIVRVNTTGDKIEKFVRSYFDHG